jgi:putative Mg2+ transporter-C (MgtC) family protein
VEESLPRVLAVLGNIGLSALLGGAIGLERERHAQPAGLRTHTIVAAAACLIMLVSMHMWTLTPMADPGRIGAQVVSGIGFLGAGAILRFGFTIRGLTTASSIWAAAGIGLAVGAGFYSGALACTVVVVLALSVLDVVEKALIRGRRVGRISIVSQDRPSMLGELEACLQRHNVEIKRLGIRRGVTEKKIEVDVDITLPETVILQSLSADLSALTGVEQVDIV